MSWPIRASFLLAWLSIATLAGTGCETTSTATPTSMGIFRAQWTPARGESQAVPFSYEGEGKATGILFTTLGKGGEHFRGSYVFVEASTKGHLVTAVFDGWSSPEWNEWERQADGRWTAEATGFAQFGHLYTNRVVAYLPGSEGHAMRCRFTLDRPEAGFVGGGRGECQTTDRSTVELEF